MKDSTACCVQHHLPDDSKQLSRFEIESDIAQSWLGIFLPTSSQPFDFDLNIVHSSRLRRLLHWFFLFFQQKRLASFSIHVSLLTDYSKTRLFFLTCNLLHDTLVSLMEPNAYGNRYVIVNCSALNNVIVTKTFCAVNGFSGLRKT